VIALFTTFNSNADRVAMHAVRRSLVEAQARQARLPLWSVDLPWPCSNQIYEELLLETWRRVREAGAAEVAFGDLFLQDVRSYREMQLRETGLTPLFPLWHLPTAALAADMVRAGVRARVTCIDPSKLPAAFAGCEFNQAFLDEIPGSVDPCGENGEFHTFVYASPEFTRPLPVASGEIVERDGFVFADLLSASAGLCAICTHCKIVTSDRGSTFYRCMLSDHDPSFPRYPRLPVHTCSGWS
jgi:diphthamide synthase (EF-2-diphthine--ammonia ligase)